MSELHDDLRAFRHYLQAERGMAANTLLAYGRDLDRFGLWVADGGLSSYLRPTVRELVNYLARLREDGLAPRSVARHLVALKMFYRFLRLEERVTDSTAELLSSPTLWERIPHVLSPDSVNKLLAAPMSLDRFYLRDRALLETLYATGCRASEVVGLKLADVYLDAAFCRCFGKGSKQRVVPLGRPAVEAIRAYLAERPASGGPLTRIHLWALVKKYCKRAGLPSTVSPHTLRHSFATHMLAGGADLRSVQELLGHASIRTTQHYTHIDRDRLKAIHRQFHPRGATSGERGS